MSATAINQTAIEDILRSAEALRWDLGRDYHDRIVEAVYADAARIADRAVRATNHGLIWMRPLIGW